MMSALSSVYFAQMQSSLGSILLAAGPQGLCGVYFNDQRDCPTPPGAESLPAAVAINDPTEGLHAQTGRALGQYRVVRPAVPSSSPLSGVGVAANDHPALVWPAGSMPAEIRVTIEQACAQLEAYFSGQLNQFTLPLHLIGTPFQVKVWQALLQIPFGQVRSYGDIATAAGYGREASRATGVAVGKNPLSIVVPCHRVVASTRRLTGYGGGLHRKCALLAHEGWHLV